MSWIRVFDRAAPALLAGLVAMGGCVQRPDLSWLRKLPLPPLNLNMQIELPPMAPPKGFALKDLSASALAYLNFDNFIPGTACRVVVDPGVYAAGVFNMLPREPRRRAESSPDGIWTAEYKHIFIPEGNAEVVSLQAVQDGGICSFWTKGSIGAVIWTADSRLLAVDERLDDRRTTTVIDPRTRMMREIALVAAPDTDRVVAANLRRVQSVAPVYWLENDKLIVHVHGRNDDLSPVPADPHWGYELCVELRAPAGVPNWRLLRGYERCP